MSELIKNGIEIIQSEPLLKRAFKWIIENSTSNHLPYHNLNHLLTVLKYCDYIATGEMVYYDNRMELYLAALFHDVNHSGGKLSDEENIRDAKESYVLFCMNDAQIYNKTIHDKVASLINCTQYPYHVPFDDLTLHHKIIRDADMMQAFEYNWIHQTTLGLATESGKTFKDFIKSQRTFLENVTFYTPTALEYKNKRWKQVMHEFRILETLYVD
jgi:predicted metal-dependent HD superfamily phosphohydrolase